jgi:hypothetical protein
MSKHLRALMSASVLAMLVAGSPLDAQEAGSDVSVNKDLAAVIALQALPCGQVVTARKQAEDDYVVACKDGNRYRVVVDPEGRLVVKKLESADGQ